MAGAGIADCLDGTLRTVLGQGFYHQPAAQPDAVDGHLINIAEGLDVPGELSVFVRQDAARDEALRSYLNQLDPAIRAELAVVVLDNTGNLVTDATELRPLATWFDLPVHAPLAAGQTDGLVPVDQTARVTALPPVAYRALPLGIVAQRRAVAEAPRGSLSEVTGAVESVLGGMAEVREWLGMAAEIRDDLGLPTAIDEPASVIRPAHTTTYAVGAYLARFGSTVQPSMVDLLQHTELTAQQVAEAIGGPDATHSAAPSALAEHLRSNPGHAALVIASDRVFWLMSDATGVPHWIDPQSARTPVPFDIDGAQDWRTAMLEQNGPRVLVVDAVGRRTELDQRPPRTRPPIASINLPTGVRAGAHGEVLIGAWPPENQTKYGLDTLDTSNLPMIAVDVRQVRGTTDLDPAQENALKNASLRHHVNNVRPIIVSTAGNPQIRGLAEQFGGALVSRVPTTLGFEWQLHVPATGQRSTFADSQLTQVMIDQAGAAVAGLGPVHEKPLPPVLIELLSFNTYAEAGAYFRDNFERLREPAVGEAMQGLTGQFSRNEVLQVFLLATEIGRHAPFLAGETPLEPTVRNSLDPEQPLPEGRPIDLTFVFDYLTARELAPAQPGEVPPGAYQTRLLWDGLLFQAMLGRQLTREETVVLARGVGEADAERALRAVNAPETARAHASIFDAIGVLVEARFASLAPQGDGTARPEVDWKGLLSIKDCLTGEDRVPWYFRIKDVLVPQLERANVGAQVLSEATELRNMINLCH